MQEIEQDYDTEGMKANDIATLRSLAFAQVQLENLEVEIYKAQKEGQLDKLDSLQKIASSLRRDIVKFQEALGITRKSRKSGDESSVVAFIEDLKKRASKVYDRNMKYLYCPETHKLLAQAWVAIPGPHKFQVWCPDCKKYHFFNPYYMGKKKKRNTIDDVPEGM